MKTGKLELELVHLNVRKERAGDGPGKTAVDLKFKGKFKPSKLKGLFATASAYETVIGNLFHEEGESKGELKCFDVGSIRLKTEGVGMSTNLETPVAKRTVDFEDGNLNAIVLTPEAGPLVGLSFRLQVHPTAAQIALLADLNGQTVTLSSKGRQGDMFDGENEEEEDDAGDGKGAPAPGEKQQEMH